MDEKDSSWDELIKEIGAAPPPDALERKRPAIETQFEPPPAAAQPAKPQRGDWNALADELGIEAREAPEPPRRPAVSEAGPSSEALEASFASIAPMESAFEEIVEEEISEIDFEEDDDDSELADEEGESPEERDEPSSLSGEAARNAFEALFEAGSFSALPPLEKPVRKPEGRQGPQWRDPDEVPETDDVTDSADDSLETDVPRRERAESGTEEPGRPRRRRRRRGGRGRDRGRDGRPHSREEGGEAPQEKDEWEAGGEELDKGEGLSERPDGEGEDRPRRRRRRRGGAKSKAGEGRASAVGKNGQSVEDGGEEEDAEAGLIGADDDDQEDDGDEDSKRAAHKNIPTWAEAIGVMVETNMQSRKNSPQRPGSPRDRDRGRGRGRGRGGRRGKP
jgi:hypothetical protein